jgi:hypothetical protein
MAPKPPLKAAAKAAALATNKEPASSSKTKTDSARKAAPKAKAEDPKSKEKEKKKVKKANGKDSARESPVLEESTAVEESTAMEEPVAAERCTENERTRTTDSVSARDQANSTPERARRDDACSGTEEKVRRRVASASAETVKCGVCELCEPAEPGHHLHLHGRADTVIRKIQLHIAASLPEPWVALLQKLLQDLAAHLLCRAWKRTLEIRRDLVGSGKLAVILVANLGKGGSRPSNEVQQKHIHTTVRHAGQRATFFIANEYNWGSHKPGEEGPGGTDKRVQRTLGFTLTTEEATCERCDQMRCSCWRYAQETQVSNKSGFYSIPGVEGETFNIIATRQAGAFVLEKMPIEFYDGLPNEAYGGRFLCAKATQRDPPGHSFLLATWHGQNTRNVENTKQVEVVEQLCARLRKRCGEEAALCCLFAGDFNIVLPKEFGGFERLDPDENVRPQWAGRWRNKNRQKDIDHMLFYAPEGSQLMSGNQTAIFIRKGMARRPRRFRMYDRQRAGLLPRRRACADAGHCSCSQEATPPDQACAGAVTHKLDGALDHDGLILELWLDGNSTSSKASLDAIIVDRMSREGTYVEGEIELMAAANAFNVFQPAYNQSTLASRAVAVAAEAARAARTRAYRAAWSVPPDVEVAEAAAQAAEEAAAIVVKEADLAKRAAETAERAAETALATVTAGAERADWETRKGWVDYYTVRNLSWVRRYTREAAEDARDARAAARRVAA